MYVRAPSLDHFVFENKNVKILFRFCRRHYFDLRIIDDAEMCARLFLREIKDAGWVELEEMDYCNGKL